MSDNSVNIRIDSRVFYGLIAVLAVVGIFAIGLYLGGMLGGEETPQAASNPAQMSNDGGIQGSQPILDANTGQPLGSVSQGDPAAVAPQAGAPPVHPDAVPVDEGQPRLWVPEVADTNNTYDFGTISPNEAAEKDFVVENVGTGVLEISDATASCGCTAAVVEDTSIAPGESTTIRVSYDPRVNQESGKFVTKQIRIKSNDPLVPLAEFTVTADVAAQ